MACFWKNERNAVEVCSAGHIFDLGNYVYIGVDGPDLLLVEIASDLSSYTTTLLSGTFDGEIYVKNRTLFHSFTDQSYTVPTVLSRYDGNGVFATIPDAFLGTAEVFSHSEGKARVIEHRISDYWQRFMESEDGEVWSPITGSVYIGASIAAYPMVYAKFGSRHITIAGGGNPFYYSDDNGVTWAAGSGYSYSGYGTGTRHFAVSGSNIIAVHSDIYVSSNGASWTKTAFGGGDAGYMGNIAASGTGIVVVVGVIPSSGFAPGVAYSWDDGASWTISLATSIGFAVGSQVMQVCWDGTQFVVFAWDGSGSKIYTSPTGAAWTQAFVLPYDNWSTFCQVID